MVASTRVEAKEPEARFVVFARDASHWLFQFSPREWIGAALKEVEQADRAGKLRNVAGAIASARRAAGMALNGALICEPKEHWGRSYVEHIAGLEKEESIPAAVREACAILRGAKAPGPALTTLRTQKSDERILEAARDIIAHAYTIVVHHEGNEHE